MLTSQPAGHTREHRRALLQPAATDTLRIGSRRWFLQTGFAGVAGLSLPDLLRHRAQATSKNPDRKAVILIWLSGGPSQLDTWDPKPDAPAEIRGPFRTIPTKLPGVRFSEHLPLQAAIADRLAVIRSVDCRSSTDHYPGPMQAGNPYAQRTMVGSSRATLPSMGSVTAKFRGPNDPTVPAFVGLADPPLFLADVLGAGPLGGAYEPIRGDEMKGQLNLPQNVNAARAGSRMELTQHLDRLRRDLDTSDTKDSIDPFRRKALDIILSGKVQHALRTELEPERVREMYGRHSLGERALLARRLVEAGVTFVTVSGTFGMFDNHGEDHFAGGIVSGLKPLLGRLDQAVSALVKDLEARGLLDDTLVVVMGEFGRTPKFSERGLGGREHWFNVMSMILAGGGLKCGRVVGSSDTKAQDVREAPVTPSDVGATVFRHLGIDLTTQWIDSLSRPQSIVTDGGRPIPELI